jgi:hypothetical protein
LLCAAFGFGSGCVLPLRICGRFSTPLLFSLCRGLLITSGLLGRRTSRLRCCLLGLRCFMLAPAIIFAGVAKLCVVVSIATYRINQCVGGFIDQRRAASTLVTLVLVGVVRVPSA